MPLIQQGLVNGDPDVDAIYRLTRINENLNIKFDENAPPLVLNNKQYAPINSQNTFYHYDSFFTLIFPLNVTFRECDILRGYIAIRLLQEINGRVAFMPPNAFQIRNSHNYHKDYLDEKRLYESIYKFVKDLDEWVCTGKDSIKYCIMDCIKMLVNKKHLAETEINFYKTWIQDLDRIGYKWPKLNKNINEKQPSVSLFYKSVEQEHSSNSNNNEISLIMANLWQEQKNYLKNLCNYDLNISPCKIDNIILITEANSKEDLKEIELRKLHFNYVIVCLQSKIANSFEELTKRSFTVLIYDQTFSTCVRNAFKIGFKQQTFLIAKDLKNFKIFNDIKLSNMKTDQQISLNDFESANPSLDNKLEANIYLLRRNVANAIMILNSTSNDSICNYYKQNQNKTMCYNLKNELDKLSWHNNDLASEYCENIDISSVFIVDYHDGPRTDISSVLVHLGQNSILTNFHLTDFRASNQFGK